MTSVFVRRPDLKTLPETTTRVILLTTGGAAMPEGWYELPGAMHLGKNKWLIPIERDEPPSKEE